MMRLKYEIRQAVPSALESWLVPIFDAPYERVARLSYEKFCADYPGEYFELVEVTSNEKCLAFRLAQQTPALPDCRTCVHAVALHTLHTPSYICGLSSPTVCANGDAYVRVPVLRLYQREAK